MSTLVQRKKRVETSEQGGSDTEEQQDVFDREEEDDSKLKLTVLEEVVLLGLKEDQVSFSPPLLQHLLQHLLLHLLHLDFHGC